MKYIKSFVAILFVCLICGCGSKITTFKQIDYTKYTEMKEADESYILYLGSSSCSHCQNFKPTLESIIEDYQLEVYYIDVATLTDKEYAVLKNDTKLQGTPTVVFVEDGIVQTSPKIVGAVSYTSALEKFRESGYLK